MKTKYVYGDDLCENLRLYLRRSRFKGLKRHPGDPYYELYEEQYGDPNDPDIYTEECWCQREGFYEHHCGEDVGLILLDRWRIDKGLRWDGNSRVPTMRLMHESLDYYETKEPHKRKWIPDPWVLAPRPIYIYEGEPGWDPSEHTYDSLCCAHREMESWFLYQKGRKYKKRSQSYYWHYCLS